MALLFAADRRDHLTREISPALAAGADVVSDRYLLSSLAYQAQEAERDWVAGLARDLRVPDLTLLLDLPVEVAAARRRAAGRPDERYDADSVQARVAARYRELCAGDPRAVILDAARSVAEVATAIAAAVDRLPAESTAEARRASGRRPSGASCPWLLGRVLLGGGSVSLGSLLSSAAAAGASAGAAGGAAAAARAAAGAAARGRGGGGGGVGCVGTGTGVSAAALCATCLPRNARYIPTTTARTTATAAMMMTVRLPPPISPIISSALIRSPGTTPPTVGSDVLVAPERSEYFLRSSTETVPSSR